jgi:hypothetical protein
MNGIPRYEATINPKKAKPPAIALYTIFAAFIVHNGTKTQVAMGGWGPKGSFQKKTKEKAHKQTTTNLSLVTVDGASLVNLQRQISEGSDPLREH